MVITRAIAAISAPTQAGVWKLRKTKTRKPMSFMMWIPLFINLSIP